MRLELRWLIAHVKASSRVHMLKSVEWSPYDRMASTLIGYSDTSGMGMGIWFLGEYASFQCPLPTEGLQDLIFFYEVLTVDAAFCLGEQYECDRIPIYSDNTNTIDMFSSLRAQLTYNSILIAWVDFTLSTSITTKVYYMPGTQNVDHLSCFQNQEALCFTPNLRINTFQTPQDAMGATKK